MITWNRTLRTPSSERFLALRAGTEIAAVDLHYLPNGTASGTVILLKSAEWKEEDIQPLLSSLDEDVLPDVDLTRGTLTYTVVLASEIVGNYEAIHSPDQPKAQ